MSMPLIVMLLFVQFVISGCSDVGTIKTDERKNGIEYSTNISELAKYINLADMKLASVTWATGESHPSQSSNDSFLPSENIWWVNAVLTFEDAGQLSSLVESCDVSYSLSEHSDIFIDSTVNKLTSNPAFISQLPLSVYDACIFESGVLSDGVMVVDLDKSQVLLKISNS